MISIMDHAIFGRKAGPSAALRRKNGRCGSLHTSKLGLSAGFGCGSFGPGSSEALSQNRVETSPQSGACPNALKGLTDKATAGHGRTLALGHTSTCRPGASCRNQEAGLFERPRPKPHLQKWVVRQGRRDHETSPIPGGRDEVAVTLGEVRSDA
jgi:hypothetical protein